MEKVLEALKKLLPESDVNEVHDAIKNILEEKTKELEGEFDTKLEEAYAELSKQLEDTKAKAETGYQEAYTIIGELRNRLELQGQEYKSQLEEGYEEAYQALQAEKEKNKTLEIDTYEEYDKKLSEMKEYMVDKLDQFFREEVSKIYDQARKDIINDPHMAEHKVALEKIVDITANYLSDQEIVGVTNSKLEEAVKELENIKGQMRVLEARNIRLSTANTKLTETVKQAEETLLEQQKVTSVQKKTEVIKEQKERKEKVKEVTGKGNTTGTEGEGVITENVEQADSGLDEMLVLAGVKKSR